MPSFYFDLSFGLRSACMAEATNAEGKTTIHDMMCLLRESLDIEAFFSHVGGAVENDRSTLLFDVCSAMRTFVSKCGGTKVDRHCEIAGIYPFFLRCLFLLPERKAVFRHIFMVLAFDAFSPHRI